MNGSVCFILKFALPPFSLPSPVECKFQNITGMEPFIPEYPALHWCICQILLGQVHNMAENPKSESTKPRSQSWWLTLY